jgi:hypothetical protein
VKLKNETLLFEAYCVIDRCKEESNKLDITEREVGFGTEAVYRDLVQARIVTNDIIRAGVDLRTPIRLYSFYLTLKGVMVLKGLKRKFESISNLPCFYGNTLKHYPCKPITTADIPVMIKDYKKLREAIND